MPNMRTVAFLPGTSDELLKALGVPYGHIVIEDYASAEVITIADARRTLKKVVDREFVSADVAARIERDIVTAGVLADMGAIFALARQYPMPKDLGRVLKFDTACPETPLFTQAMGQGRILGSTGEALSVAICTLTEGFVACRNLAKIGVVRLFDTCTLMRDMSDANLVLDDVEYKTRWDGLTTKQREEITAEIRTATTRMTAEMVRRNPFLAALFGGELTDE